MDKMTPLGILAVSFPQAVLNIYFGFLIVGEKTHLYLIDRINVIRLSIAVCLMTLFSSIGRMLVPDLVFILLFDIVTYTCIIMCTYRMKWRKSFIIVLAFIGFVITVEMIYTPAFLYITDLSLSQILEKDYLKLIYSSIERVAQLFAVVSLWNWSKVLIKLKSYKEVRGTFCFYMLLLLFVEVIYFSTFIFNFNDLTLRLKLVYSIGGFLFSAINFWLFKLLSVLSNAVLKKEVLENLEYKKEMRNNFISIHSLLEKGDIELAKRVCENSLMNRQ